MYDFRRVVMRSDQVGVASLVDSLPFSSSCCERFVFFFVIHFVVEKNLYILLIKLVYLSKRKKRFWELLLVLQLLLV